MGASWLLCTHGNLCSPKRNRRGPKTRLTLATKQKEKKPKRKPKQAKKRKKKKEKENQKQQKKKEKENNKTKKGKMEYGRVYRRTKEEQALCMAKCTGGGPRGRSKSGIGPCCAEECGPVTMHMIDVAERDRGTVCRRVAAYYIAKATALGYAGDHDGARRAFRKFLAFARAEKAGRADKAQKAQKADRASRGSARQLRAP
jgi:hypothetical protein